MAHKPLSDILQKTGGLQLLQAMKLLIAIGTLNAKSIRSHSGYLEKDLYNAEIYIWVDLRTDVEGI